ncbi:glutathione S-transferase, partial [Salmonella enterica]
PVIVDLGMVFAESGAFLEYLQVTYFSIGRFKPADAQGKQHFRFWLHYAEGSLMPSLFMRLLFISLGKP